MSKEEPKSILDTEREKHTERLIHDDFREAYDRPFYTWNDKTEIKQHQIDYKKYLAILTEITPRTDEVEYRINVVIELLKDCK